MYTIIYIFDEKEFDCFIDRVQLNTCWRTMMEQPRLVMQLVSLYNIKYDIQNLACFTMPDKWSIVATFPTIFSDRKLRV